MGLAAGFKHFVAASLPTSVVPHEPESDAFFTDAPCILHSFSPSSSDPVPAGLQLYMRMKRAVLSGSSADSTVVVCFDRQEDTPTQKSAAHKKRRQAKRVWTRGEVKELLRKDELPRGDDWNDLLASRDVRELVAEYIRAKLVSWYKEEGRLSIKRLVVHNGGEDAIILEGGREVSSEGAPRAGEADLALVLWAEWLHEREPEARVLIRTVDTDVLAIASLHTKGVCVISLTHHEEKHRLCVNVDQFREAVGKVYGITARDFVAIAISKGCDFAKPTLKGIPDWHDTLRLCSSYVKTHTLFKEDSSMDFVRFVSMLRNVVATHKRAKLENVNTAHRESVEFAMSYWTIMKVAT